MKYLINITMLIFAANALALNTTQDLERTPEILSEKIYAVHATTFFPTEKYLVAGMSGFERIPGKQWQELVNQSRPLIYFSLGELVKGDPNDGWEEMPYVVLTPLKNILDQMVQLSVGDTFILGNFHLTPDSILIVKDDCKIDFEGFPCKVVKTSDSMRNAVSQEIEQAGGYCFKTERVGNIGFYFDGIQRSPNDFFAPLVQTFPYIYVDGDGDEEEKGELARSFLYVCNGVSILLDLFASESHPKFSVADLKDYVIILEHYIHSIEFYLKNYNRPPSLNFDKAGGENLKANESILNIIKTEAYFREIHGRTLWNLQNRNRALYLEVIDWSSSSEKLIENLEKPDILEILAPSIPE